MIKKIFLLVIVFTVSGKIYSQNSLKEVSDISLSPIMTFEKQCSRCHGYEGKDYGEDFAELTDEKLKNFVEDMMFGPAFLNPTNVELKAMSAYNKAIQNKKPFAVAVNAKSFLGGKEKELKINATSGAELSIDNNKEIKIKKTEEVWTLSYDFEKVNKLRIIISKNGVSSSMIFPDALWSK